MEKMKLSTPPSSFNPFNSPSPSSSRLRRHQWDNLLDENDAAEPPQLVVERTSAKKRKLAEMEEQSELYRAFSNKELKAKIERLKRNLANITLPDGGEKYRIGIKRQEDELERRYRLQRQKILKNIAKFGDMGFSQESTLRKPGLIIYAQTPTQQFFTCGNCRNHIALMQDFQSSREDYVIFKNCVNVERSDICRLEPNGRYVVDVCCSQCRTTLGYQLISFICKGNILKSGYFIIKISGLRLWNGKEYVCARDFKLPPPVGERDEGSHLIPHPIFICRNCRSEIASAKYLIQRSDGCMNKNQSVAFFERHLTNVTEVTYVLEKTVVTSDLQCSDCSKILGRDVFLHGTSSRPSKIVTMIYLKRLLECDGVILRYADSLMTFDEEKDL